MSQKNQHLVPVNIQDLADKLSDKNLRENEYYNYIMRMEAIRDFCSETLRKSESKTSTSMAVKKPSRR